MTSKAREDIQANRKALYERVEWKNPLSQLQNRVRGADLQKYFSLTDTERIGIEKSIRLNVQTTPYYLSLSDPFDPTCPIRKTIVPTEEESIFSPEEDPDPLHEERLSPVQGLTHMYPNRALLFANHQCSVYCRHCMRGRKVSDHAFRMGKSSLEEAFVYLEKNSKIDDVIISGGDPLNLSNSKLELILKRLSDIPHVNICRIGTRNPVTLPFRINDSLIDILLKYNTDKLSIFCNTQFNHPKECTQDAKDSILKLLKAGVSVGNQAVLLKGINDEGETMLELHKKLLGMRVRAYYLYDPELIPGSRGFRTPLKKGIEVIEYMRGKISGMGIPQFVSDLPGGGGKIALTPNYYLGYIPSERKHVFRSSITNQLHYSFEPIHSTEEYPLYENFTSNSL